MTEGKSESTYYHLNHLRTLLESLILEHSSTLHTIGPKGSPTLVFMVQPCVICGAGGEVRTMILRQESVTLHTPDVVCSSCSNIVKRAKALMIDQ